MNREQMEKLLDLIDAKIAEARAELSSDGGLLERRAVSTLETELRKLCPHDED